MLAISIALVIIAGMALWYFNKKLELNKPIPPVPLNEEVQKDPKLLAERINTLEISMGLTVRR